MSSPMAEKAHTPVEFTANHLDWLLKVHEAVFDAIEQAETRLVVEVWSQDDRGPVAWIEAHPEDNEARIRFAPPISPPGEAGGQ